MKKLISIAVSAILTLGTGSALVIPAMQSNNLQESYTCELQNCTRSDIHTHGICLVTGCMQLINHEHDGIIYFPHYDNDGHDYHNSADESTCTVANCRQTSTHGHSICDIKDCEAVSEHEHDGIIYYGHNRSDGHNIISNTLSPASFTCNVSGCTKTEQHSHTVCNNADCTKNSNHEHNGMIYYGHNDNDGHNHNIISNTPSPVSFTCNVSNCTKITQHNHTVCNIADCTKTSNHEHNGVIYYGHNDNDGHNHQHNTQNAAPQNTAPQNTVSQFKCEVSGCNKTTNHNHTLCMVSGCNQMTNHEHNGIIYYGHNSKDGHAYHNCGTSGCTQTSNHIHNSCGVSGCSNTENHSHGNGHSSEHGGGHH